MSFPYPNNTNIYRTDSRYGGYCNLQPLDTMMGSQQTGVAADEGDIIFDSPGTPFDSFHGYPAIADAPFSLAVAEAHERDDLNPATDDCIDRWMDIDRWIEDNQRIKAQRWPRAAHRAADPSDDFCLGPETDETPSPTTSTSSAAERNQPHRERHPQQLQCKWEGCTYSKTFSRTADVVRHVRVVHLARGKFRCPMDTGCKTFNRKDNLMAHLQRRHNVTVKR